jgi:hypothetical protein
MCICCYRTGFVLCKLNQLPDGRAAWWLSQNNKGYKAGHGSLIREATSKPVFRQPVVQHRPWKLSTC